MPQRLKSPSTTSESNDLRNAGLKVTLPRLKILDILADGSARHMSAEDIYKKLLVSNEDIGLATVYRVLTQFEAAGLVTVRGRPGGKRPGPGPPRPFFLDSHERRQYPHQRSARDGRPRPGH